MSAGLVIFDCDGVLIDSERLAVRIDAEILAELGWPLSEEEIIERFVGRSHAYMVSEIEKHLGRTLPEDFDLAGSPRYRQVFRDELTTVAGVIEALDAITLPVCVASSSGHERLEFTLGLVGLYDRFKGRIFSAVDVEDGKPAPDLFLHAAASMGVPPAECLVVEDSRWGVMAARAAGMRSFGYAGGLTDAAELSGPGTVVFDDMRDLPKLIRDA